MNTISITKLSTALSKVSADFTITRGITNAYSITLLDQDGEAYDTSAVSSWQILGAHDFSTATPVLIGNSAAAVDNVLTANIDANTTELTAYLNGKQSMAGFISIVGLDAELNAVELITVEAIFNNSVYESDAEPTPVGENLYYLQAQVDAMINALYTKAEIDAMMATVYTKAETDAIINAITPVNLPVEVDATEYANAITISNPTAYVKVFKDVIDTAGDNTLTINETLTGDADNVLTFETWIRVNFAVDTIVLNNLTPVDMPDSLELETGFWTYHCFVVRVSIVDGVTSKLISYSHSFADTEAI